MKPPRLTGALSACLLLLFCFATAARATAVHGQGTWETSLQARDFDGNPATIEGYYDTVLDITWLANANYAGTSMDWPTAMAWVGGLTIDGIDGWRLPTVTESGNPGCDFAYSGTDCGYNVNPATGEMASLFFDTLGNRSYYDTNGSGPQTGWGLSNTGPFSDIQTDLYYWTGTVNAADTYQAWVFDFNNGGQGTSYNNNYYAWAVHSGDVGTAVATVPVPAAVWLFGTGLLGLLGLGRRRRH